MDSFDNQILAVLKNGVFSAFISCPRLFESPAPDRTLCKRDNAAKAVKSQTKAMPKVPGVRDVLSTVTRCARFFPSSFGDFEV